VFGATQLHDDVYIVCGGSSSILRFNAITHQRLADIDVKDLAKPGDIVACEQTSRVYVADWEQCVWRVSADGSDIKRWLPKSPSDSFRPLTLSVTSTRLLVTSQATKQLTQTDAGGDELRRVQLPEYMELEHAVESSNGTFVVSHENTQLEQYQVSEVNTDGEVLRHFSSSRLSVVLPQHIAVDSHGNTFAADTYSRRILLLDAQLTLRRCVVDEHQLNFKELCSLQCYRERSGQLFIARGRFLAVFDVLRR